MLPVDLRIEHRVRGSLALSGKASQSPGHAYRFIAATVQPTAKIGMGA